MSVKSGKKQRKGPRSGVGVSEGYESMGGSGQYHVVRVKSGIERQRKGPRSGAGAFEG